MNNFIIQILAMACITILWVSSTPTVILRQKLGITYENKYSIIRFFAEMSQCALCSGFWIGLIYFKIKYGLEITIIYAAITSVLAEILYKRI